MKKVTLSLLSLGFGLIAQTNPAITSWLINTTNITGRHYVDGNSTPINDTTQANVQRVRYSTNYAYVNASGVPAYIVGPYLDGNPALATHQNWLFQIPLNPTENTGTKTETPLGAIGVFINGVLMYDYKDGGSYDSGTGQDVMNGGDGAWNRNAVAAEMDGFDCAKGHPSPVTMGPPQPGQTVEGSYHHHQNPTAFNLDETVVSTICDAYLADGLYVMDPAAHSPLLGFAFDGYPVYGAYGYANTDGTGGIKRIESSYQLRNITQRTHHADGTDVVDGPAVGGQYPIGWYREDFEFIQNSGNLDEHNGRFCVTPEYPAGTYAYFTTVDDQENSFYPFIVGPTYYGNVVTDNFTTGGQNTTVGEATQDYNGPVGISDLKAENLNINIFPNPSSEFVTIQINQVLRSDVSVEMYDMGGKLVQKIALPQGSTVWFLDVTSVYDGNYVLKFSQGDVNISRAIQVKH